MLNKTSISLLLFTTSLTQLNTAAAATVYVPGTAPAEPTLIFGNHLITGDVHPSVAGTGGGSIISNNGDTLNGLRTYIYDSSASTDLADGVASRGDNDFAMLIWDMGSAFDSMRLYTHQDHYSGGPITTDFVAQDVMEYSVWGSNNGDDFLLLSDVTGFDLTGEGAGLPTYTFAGAAPTVVWRDGSEENGALNAYTREYVFSNAYQYYGIRSSSITISANDADPELDAIAAFNTIDRCTINPSDPSCVINTVPVPPALYLFFTGLLGLIGVSRRNNHT